MADSITGSSSTNQILNNYEKYKEYFVGSENDELGQDQFLALMVEQMRNQDFMNPTDNSEYIAQMAQFSMVQQIQQMNYYTNATYATSLVGKTVKLGTVNQATGDIVTSTGIVSGVGLNGTSFEITVGGKSYQLENIMEVLSGNIAADTTQDKTDKEDTPKTPEAIDTDENTEADTNKEIETEPDYSQGV